MPGIYELAMSTEEKSIQSAVLVTIIGESALRYSIVKLLKSKGAEGYTITEAQGEGGHGKRTGDIAGYNTNFELKTIVSSQVADDILQAMVEIRKKHALIAYRYEVEAIAN